MYTCGYCGYSTWHYSYSCAIIKMTTTQFLMISIFKIENNHDNHYHANPTIT